MMQTTTQSRSTSLTRSMRVNKWFSAITAAMTVFFFLSTWYIVPSAHAASEAVKADRARNQYHPRGRTDEEKLSNTLQDIKERVAERRVRVRQRVKEESDLWQGFLNLFGMSRLAKESLDRLNSMADQAELLNQKTLQGFDAIEKELIDKALPEEILQRHYDAVNKYRSEHQRFRDKLRKARTAQSLQDQDSALGDLDEFMGKQQFKRRQQPFDPNKLPFGTPDPKKTREPITDPQQLNQLLGLNTEPGLIEKVADALSTPAYAAPVDGPTPADLTETIDVQLTDAIKDLATQLNHDPVRIYNWVRNNIDFMPTYGSIQGSNMTLQSKRGNAFDTASLLIALLRASNIPAKYAYGTIRVPVDKVMNWVGGLEVSTAAQSVLAQGGIPNLARTQGGVVTHIDLEHIWVEAWVDFEPSRGANNIQGDSWVPLDASFKQYEYTDGIDIQSQVPFDAQGFNDTITNSATIDEAAGSVQNIDQQYIQDQISQYQQQVEDYINTQVPSDATIGDVLGKKIIGEVVSSVLAAGLPYQRLATSRRFAEIPTNLRHKYRLTLQNDWGEDIFSQMVDLPAVAGKTIALSFKPATANDEKLLENLVPDTITDISQIPNTFPGYLINVEAEFVINNEAQATGATFRMGDEITMNQALYSPQFGWEGTDSTIVAGEYHAVGISGAGIAAVQIEILQSEMQNVQALLEDCRDNDNCDPIEGLSKHQLSGSILQTGVLSWFGFTQIQDNIVSKQQKVVYQPLPSYGKFSTSASVQYSWGIPRNISFPGVMMDIDHNRLLVEAEDGDNQSRINFARLSGTQGSAYEHLVPERMFSTTQNPAEGISAVKALNIAIREGQRIFNLTQNNIAQLNNINIEPDARAEIRNALLVGKQVSVHESPINAFGWTGSGYIIFDPLTGSGAYKISGGVNGGEFLLSGVGLVGIALIGFAGVATFPLTVIISPFLLMFTLVLGLHLILLELLFNDNIPWSDINSSMIAIVGIVATAIGAMMAPIVLAIVSIIASVLGLIL